MGFSRTCINGDHARALMEFSRTCINGTINHARALDFPEHALMGTMLAH